MWRTQAWCARYLLGGCGVSRQWARNSQQAGLALQIAPGQYLLLLGSSNPGAARRSPKHFLDFPIPRRLAAAPANSATYEPSALLRAPRKVWARRSIPRLVK